MAFTDFSSFPPHTFITLSSSSSILPLHSTEKRYRKKTMYRTSSWNRLPDDDYIHGPPPTASTILRMAAFQGNEPPPPYDTEPDLARKERSRNKFAENAVHVIPLVLLLCAAILWFFSTLPQVGYPRKNKTLLG